MPVPKTKTKLNNKSSTCKIGILQYPLVSVLSLPVWSINLSVLPVEEGKLGKDCVFDASEEDHLYIKTGSNAYVKINVALKYFSKKSLPCHSVNSCKLRVTSRINTKHSQLLTFFVPIET